jgi:hypothetical protein
VRGKGGREGGRERGQKERKKEKKVNDEYNRRMRGVDSTLWSAGKRKGGPHPFPTSSLYSTTIATSAHLLLHPLFLLVFFFIRVNV